MANAFGAVDKAGNWYGGTGVGSAGEGDIVRDVNNDAGCQGTVKKVFNTSEGWKVLVSVPAGSTKACSGFGNTQEFECLARQLTIISHSDGTGLVASGQGAITQTGTAPPTGYNFFH